MSKRRVISGKITPSNVGFIVEMDPEPPKPERSFFRIFLWVLVLAAIVAAVIAIAIRIAGANNDELVRSGSSGLIGLAIAATAGIGWFGKKYIRIARGEIFVKPRRRL